MQRRVMSRLAVAKFLLPAVIFLSFFLLGLFLGPQPYPVSPSVPPPAMVFEDDPEEIYISSSYFYPKSESLGNNAIAVVFSGNFEILTKFPVLQVLGSNSKDNMNHSAQCLPLDFHILHYSIDPRSQVAQYYARKQIPPGENLALQLYPFQIPFKTVSYRKREVVTCVSPLFANEQWQYLVLAAHLYKRFGSFMHVYVRSMVEPVYKLMLEYQKEGYLEIEPWLRLNLSSVPVYEFNPNINVEFRNQAAAQTDCLLKYKESAEFISFMDLDDILIPRLANTYKEEFNILFNIESFKEVNRKKRKAERVPLEMEEAYEPLLTEITDYDSKKFSLNQMFSSMYFKKKNETGKMVTRPRFFNHTWIHWPIELPEGFVRYDVPPEKNVITHLKILDEELGPINLNITEPEYLEKKVWRQEKRPLIRETDIQQLQKDFERMKAKSSIASIWSKLPRRPFYLDLVTYCFNHTFYRYHYGNRFDRIKCPGPDRCRLPQNSGILCANSKADYSSSSGGFIFNVHFARNPRFSIEDGCIP